MQTETGFEPGITANISEKNYHAFDLCSASRLRALKQGPGHCYAAITRPAEQSPAMRFGEAVHCAILEPNRFTDRFVFAPDVDRRTKEGKQTWSDFGKSNIGKTILTKDEEERLSWITTHVKAHPTICTLLDTAKSFEATSIFELHGVKCKARADIVNEKFKSVIDFKTTSTEDKQAFEKNIYKLGYHIQGAFYLKAFPEMQSFIIITIDSEAPYAIEVYRLNDEAITVGNGEVDWLVPQYQHCIIEGHWSDIQDIGIPNWALTQ